MIPILYEKTETTFTSNGLGRLVDCTRCIVTEERNGVYEVEFDYPITGQHYADIQEGRIIAVTHDDTGDIQPFDIYKRTAPISGIVTFYASHISYRLNGIVTNPFTSSGISNALTAIKTNSIGGNPFTFSTDKTTTGTYTVAVPSTARALLGGEENSILDVFGTGEYEFDKFNVKLWLHRGTDTDVQIRYGKNMSDIEHELDYSASYNGVAPYWYNTDPASQAEDPPMILVKLPEGAIYASGSTYDGRNTVAPLDLTQDFEDAVPTVAQLRTLAQEKLNASDTLLPLENITVSFVQLWQTEEYKDIAPLQTVNLCDTVTVVYPELGIDGIRSKVIKVVYNTLLDRYDEMELGDQLTSYAALITSDTRSALADLEDGLLIVKSSADKALYDAGVAHDAAIRAQASADDAQASADDAARSAAAAQASADQATIDAGAAHDAANNAQRDATTANKAANGALDQLSVVEDVIGVLNWVAEHGTYAASTDTEVVPGKYYFTRSGSAPNYTYTVVTNPTGNPSTQGYYELTGTDEAVSNYVSSHLALTNQGLWVQNDNNSYKILLASDGMKVYDENGILVATFGESIQFSSTRPQYIGSSSTYIIFDPNTDTINIGGTGINFNGDTPLADMIDEVNSERLIIETNYVNNDIVFLAKLIQKGRYVTVGSSDYPPADFEWYRQTPNGHEFLGNGTSLVIAKASVDYGETVYCTWTRRHYAYLLNNAGNNLVTNNGSKLMGRTEY